MPQPITEADVRKVAKLSRLKLTDGEIAQFTGQLADVLGYIDKIQELDLEGVEPMAHPTDITNAFRADVVTDALTPEQALANAPASDPPYFKVPKVLGDGGA